MSGDGEAAGAGEASAREAEILAATVGERKLLHGPVHLSAYDPAWPGMFTREARRIRGLLREGVLVLEHVGSTSVPGLCAKPIIDMLLAVEDSADEPSYVAPLEAQGYVLRIREPDWFEHRLLKPPDVEGHLHVFSAGCPEIGRMLRFRDRLRASADDRRLYEEVKRELAARTWRYTQNYADAKSEVIERILSRAGPRQA